MRPIASVRFRTRRAILAARMQRARRRLANDPWITSAEGIRMRVDPDDPRAWRLATSQQGSMDTALAGAWRAVATALVPATVVDIGANYGEVTFAASYPAATALEMFEPNPTVAACLRETLRVNGVDARLHEVAVSDADGEAILTVASKTSGWSTLEPDGTDGHAVAVRTVRLSDVVAPAASLQFKIDVEGHEAAVLRGARDLLDATPDWRGFVELRPSTVDEVLDLLCEAVTCFVRRADLGVVDTEHDAERVKEHLESCRDPRWPFLRDLLVRPRRSSTVDGR